MTKPLLLFLIQLLQTVVSILVWVIPSAIWYKVKYKSMKGFKEKIGLKKITFKNLFKNLLYIMLAYLFTILVYVILAFNGGMTTEVLNIERQCEPVWVLVIMILMMGIRSGLGEEIFFRGVIANNLFEKFGTVKGNLLQALIFAIPHIFTFISLPSLEGILFVINAFVIGLALGYVSHKEKVNITYGIIYHGVINMIAVLVSWYIF